MLERVFDGQNVGHIPRLGVERQRLKGINLHDPQQLHGRKVIAFLAEAVPRFDLTGAIRVDRG